MTAPGAQLDRIPDLGRVLLLLVFGLSTTGVIEIAADAPLGRADLLLFAGSFGAIVTALAWILMLALARSRAWAITMALGVWIPYVNLILASVFARRYWGQGGRTPALLGLAGVLGQAVASIRFLLPALPPLV